jgi:hypothetical protein
VAYKDGVPVPSNLFEAAAWHKAIRVACRCGHAVTFNPHGLWWLFERKGWDMRFPEMRQHFACRPCALDKRGTVRPSRVDPVEEMPEITLPMPPEREWKQAQRRFR